MTGVYLFALSAGLPLVLWTLFGGGDDGGDGEGGDGADGGSDGIGALMMRLLPLSTIALASSAFGLTGVALSWVGTAAALTLLLAVCTAVVAGALNTALFSFIRRSSSSTSVSELQLAGATGRVTLPIGPDRRGRVAISAAGQEMYLSAQTMPTTTGAVDELEVGAPVLVVEVRDGIARVVRLDPELT
ncbi:MAG: hypothetical protein JJE52_01915 [Acidimicrobiia bacterium]|nr:hypothetical protein [Acidimicrobiia bacterium]